MILQSTIHPVHAEHFERDLHLREVSFARHDMNTRLGFSAPLEIMFAQNVVCETEHALAVSKVENHLIYSTNLEDEKIQAVKRALENNERPQTPYASKAIPRISDVHRTIKLKTFVPDMGALQSRLDKAKENFGVYDAFHDDMLLDGQESASLRFAVEWVATTGGEELAKNRSTLAVVAGAIMLRRTIMDLQQTALRGGISLLQTSGGMFSRRPPEPLGITKYTYGIGSVTVTAESNMCINPILKELNEQPEPGTGNDEAKDEI